MLPVLSERRAGMLLFATFCYLTQVPMRGLSSRRKTMALKMNFLKSLKVRMMRTSKEVSVSLPPGKHARL